MLAPQLPQKPINAHASPQGLAQAYEVDAADKPCLAFDTALLQHDLEAEHVLVFGISLEC